MQQIVTELLDLLRLERLEDNLFRGQSRDIGTRYVFGGQVLGQALSAAQQTVDPVRLRRHHAQRHGAAQAVEPGVVAERIAIGIVAQEGEQGWTRAAGLAASLVGSPDGRWSGGRWEARSTTRAAFFLLPSGEGARRADEG